MSSSWSRQLETRYELRLSADSQCWLDDACWAGPGGAEFHEALEPERLLEPEPGLIWGGFMLPDTLPWIGNGYGDWLCLRIDDASTVSEIVHWSHAGGSWAPVGADLAEALLYDAACERLYPPPPEMTAPASPPAERYRFAEWGRERLRVRRGVEVEPFWGDAAQSGADPLAALARCDVATFAVARDQALRRLESPLKARGDRRFARQLGVPWEPDFVRWLFDATGVPAEWRGPLAAQAQTPLDELLRQDWEAAAAIARGVIKRRVDLAWPFDVLGWAAERRGELSDAARWYARGVRASAFSDEATRLRTHWFAEQHGKFAASRLSHLRAHVARVDSDDAYVRLYLDGDLNGLRERVAGHWLAQGRAALRERNWREAYESFYQAGWDLGWQSLQDFDEVLDGLQAAATEAGWTGRAALATLHRQQR